MQQTSILNSPVYPPSTGGYNRQKSVDYARLWAYRRNPAYLDFHGLGGDSTNFVSQCLYIGGEIMNYTPLYGWYYISGNDCSAAWTGVEFLYSFLTQNEGPGPYGRLVSIEQALPGDVIQFGDENGSFYHTALLTEVPEVPSVENMLVAAHSSDCDCRPVSSYQLSQFRIIHIEGFRAQAPQGIPDQPPIPQNPQMPPQQMPSTLQQMVQSLENS